MFGAIAGGIASALAGGAMSKLFGGGRKTPSAGLQCDCASVACELSCFTIDAMAGSIATGLIWEAVFIMIPASSYGCCVATDCIPLGPATFGVVIATVRFVCTRYLFEIRCTSALVT